MRCINISLAAMTVLLALSPRSAPGSAIVFETQRFRYEIAENGQSAALIDLRDGTDYVGSNSVPMAILVQDEKEHAAISVKQEGDSLRVAFADTDVKAVIRVEINTDWLAFQLMELSDALAVDELVFPNVCVSIKGRRIGVHSGTVSSDRFTIGCQALNSRTNSRLEVAGRPVSLRGECYRRFGLIGARVALFAAPKDEVLKVIQAIELAEPQVPRMTLDGVWARTAPDSRKSYLFIDMTEANADEVVQIAQELNFGYILVYAHTWATSLGSYPINTTAYPKGIESLKHVVAKAHAAGLKVGIHCLTGFVDHRDALVTPKPDPRLAKDGAATLAANLDERSRFVPTTEAPAGFPDDVAYGDEPQGFDVQIDEEIISYRGLSTRPPYGLDKCIRGANGTERAAHRKGAVIHHMTQRYGHYLVDCDTDLARQVARRYAEVINSCDLDMIYFDGASANLAFGKKWGWRYVSQIPLQSAQMWRREVRVGGSCFGPLYWHLQSFQTCNDFVEIGVKRFLDHDKLRSARGVQQNFVPVDLGWWGLHTWAPHRRATTPDEIEYICQKAIGFDTCWSLETTLKKIHDCGRWSDIKRLIGTYEQLRLQPRLSESVKRELREQGAEFKLISGSDGREDLIPVQYGPAHLVLDAESRSWQVANGLGEQPLRIRLHALPMLSSYADPNNPILLDQRDLSRYVKMRVHTECSTDLAVSNERTPGGESCIEFSAESKCKSTAGWAEHRADLVRLGERIATPALIEGLPEQMATTERRWARSLGVWVHGDGKGEVLNIQLRCANGGYRDHYVDIRFKGWKYCELTRPESDCVFDFDAGYSKKHAVRHFQYDRLTNVFLRYNSIPSETTVRCLIGPLKALREHWRSVKDPAISVNGQTIRFPCRLECEQYLEYDGSGDARLYDREGRALRHVKPQGQIPLLHNGNNAVAFSCDTDPIFSQRAYVTIIRIDQ